MMFSATATHALRAVVWLAANERSRTMLGRELAKKVQVPPDYLSKVLATLARAGILSASRGAKGGYRLARPAARIRLAEIVRPFEGKRTRPGCLLRPERACRTSNACSAHCAWRSLRRKYTDFLEKTTVADIRGGG